MALLPIIQYEWSEHLVVHEGCLLKESYVLHRNNQKVVHGKRSEHLSGLSQWVLEVLRSGCGWDRFGSCGTGIPGTPVYHFQKSQLNATRGDSRRLLQQQKEAVLRLAEVSRKIFELAPLTKEGDGVTDGEAIAIVTRYFLFMEEVARDSQLFQNSQSVA